MDRPTRSILKRIAPAALVLACTAGPASANVIYDSLWHPQPVNAPSQPYQAQQVSEFGDQIQFAGRQRNLSSVTVSLSDWAHYSTYSTNSSYSASGWTWPLTLNLYTVNNSASTPAVGSLIASRTISPLIKWAPEPDGCGGDATAFTGPDGTCNHGLAQNVTFDFSGVTVPDQIIYGLAFNTQTYGADPTGTSGPYNSLNFLLNWAGSTAPYINVEPSIGSQVHPHYLFIDGAGYTVTTGTANTFSQNSYPDPYWYVPAVQFNAVPEPSTFALFAAGLIGLAISAARKRRKGCLWKGMRG